MKKHKVTMRAVSVALLLGIVGVLLIACGAANQPPVAPAAPAAAQQQPNSNRDVPAIGAGPAAAPVATAATVRLLKVEPSKGYVGDTFTINGDGFAPGKAVEFVWLTVDGTYATVGTVENIEFHEKKFTDRRLSLGKATADAQGRVSAAFKAPDDYGEVHDIFAVVDGQDVGKGGYRIQRKITMTPERGPIGTPITIKATGLGWKTYESTLAIRYDNNHTGIVTAVTTRGTATVQIRAAGRAGKHVIDVNHGGKSVPYLNNQQSGTAHIPDFRFEFSVTDDKVMPAALLDFPDLARVARVGDGSPRTASVGQRAAPSASASLEPVAGPILSRSTLKAKGLTPNAEVETFWVTVRGNRVSPSGWSVNETPLHQAKAAADGSLVTAVQIPDDLGGWHSIKLVQGDKVVAEVPYYIERSLVAVTPQRVKAGEIFTLQIKGVGWTELDNGVAVTYDNSYIGFACGFNSNGDATMNLTATGGPGIHLIDLYPMIYQGHGKPPWGYQVPFLSYKEDFPGLDLGYRIPAFRLAIEVIE